MFETSCIAVPVAAILVLFVLASGPFSMVGVAVSRASHWPALALSLIVASGPAGAQDNSMLLVAEPQLTSPVFQRSVVLVTPHGNGAAVGIIINHPQPMDAARLFPGDELLQDAGKIRFGGPVNPTALVFLFRAQERPAKALHLFDNVYMGNDRELLARQLRRPRQESGLQVYAGYAGWAPGQLQAEIMLGSWHTVKARAELLFNTDRESMWEKLARKMIENWI